MADVRIATRELTRAVDPEAAFSACFASSPGSFWLDSSLHDGTAARWSFMGSAAGPASRQICYDSTRAELTIVDAGGSRTIHGNVFDYLATELQRMRCASPELPFDFNGGFVGWFGYELKADCGAARKHVARSADASFVFADRLLAFDHLEGRVILLAVIDGAASTEPGAESWFSTMEEQLATVRPCVLVPPVPQLVRVRLRTSYRQYLDDIRTCLKHISEGESYEICLTHRIDLDANARPLDVYHRLRHSNPSPYAAYLDIDGTQVLCSSPERYLRVTRDRRVESKPIKGTAPRGRDEASDRRLREELEASEKDRAENLMIVDLLRNDLGRVCQVGSVHVPVLMGIESYQSVHQMVSTVRGTLRDDATVVDCVRASFPGGSMTGAPKLRTMSIIDDLEQVARGVYSGSVGYLGLNGTADLNIVIRTIVATAGRWSLGVGGAIVALSDPEAEFEETLVKARAPITAVLEGSGARLPPGTYRRIGSALRTTGEYSYDPCGATS